MELSRTNALNAERRKQEKIDAAMKQAVHDAPTTVGATLPNGGIILAIKENETRERVKEYIVLALVKGFQPFVTWRYGVGITDLATGGYGPVAPYCWSGEYYRNLEEAIEDFNDRI
jgi:hypothetical protein